MASCKECVHYDVCYHIEHYGRHMETEEPCGGFLNKADYAEVVRCKDCKYYCLPYGACYNNLHSFMVGEKAFCSYGKRK